MTIAPAAVALALVALTSCTRPGEQRALAELDVGSADLRGITVQATGGLAAIRELGDGKLDVWSQTPDLELSLTLDDTANRAWTIIARNTLVDAVLTENGVAHRREPGGFPTVATFAVALGPGTH